MSVFGDLKHALRGIRKAPGFALAAVLILALGIGANTAIFSIVNGVLLQPLPFERPEQLVQLWHTPPAQQFPGAKTFSLSAANYLDWEQRNDVFAKSAVYAFTHFRLTGSGEPQEVQAARVEPTFFDVLRGHIALGRAITANDALPGNEHVVVLSHRLWQAQFAGDAQIVGKTVQLNNQSYAVVGVMAGDFQKPGYAQMWTPLIWDPAEKLVRGEHHFIAVARLKPDVSVAQAQAQLDSISATLAQQYPADDAGWGALVQPLRDATVGEVRTPLFVLLGAVAFVLLIACANVANLILAKTLDRRKEIAIRTALGAGRARIVRQMLAEAVLISIIGATLGLVVAHFATRLVVHFLGASLPRANEIGLDLPVLAFALVVAVLCGVASGLIPAWRMSRADPQDALKQGGRSGSAGSSQRTRAALVVGEVALSLVLLTGAGLMIRTLWNLRDVDLGFEAQHVLTASVRVADGDYATPAQQVAFADEALRRVRALPGVQAAGMSDSLPLQDGSTQPVAIEGQPVTDLSHQPEVSVRMITPGYMSAMRMAIVRGRDIGDQDTSTSLPVVLISEAMAKQFWPGEDAVGKRLTLSFFPNAVREVIGVVADVKERGLDHNDPVSALYWPVSQVVLPESMGRFHGIPMQLVMRTGNDPASASSALRAALHEIAPNTPVVEMRTMQDIVDESLSPQRFNMLLLAAFAALALLLAGMGIYSVLAYAVRQRMREIGMRVALGARAVDVLRTVVVDGLKPTLVGIAIGVAAALVLGRVLGSLVFGIHATDPATLTCVSLILLVVGLIASLLPAWRATRVSPLTVLRDQ
jgi:putative ABC transport system permease protein